MGRFRFNSIGYQAKLSGLLFSLFSLGLSNILLDFRLYFIGYYCVETGIVISVGQSCIQYTWCFIRKDNGRQNIFKKEINRVEY